MLINTAKHFNSLPFDAVNRIFVLVPVLILHIETRIGTEILMLVMEPPGDNPSQIILFLYALFYAISHQEAFKHVGLRTGHDAPIRRTIIEGRQRPFHYATFKIVVEQDESPDRPALESAKMSRDYLRTIGQ